jgi:anti-sigma factor RsiW
MGEDFGLLVDFLHGELDEEAAGHVRARLENDPKLFETFERIRRVYGLLQVRLKSR